MAYTLRPAVRSSAKLLIGLYSESGGGKTLSALLLARGFVGPNATIAMIETESGRGEVYADSVPGGYMVRPIVGDFNPKQYGEALSDCEKAGAKALVIDSASHEWEGAGGVLSLAADNQAAGKKGPLVWQQPKMSHQRDFVLRLMSTPIDIVIVCMRAKYPMEEVVQNGKKEWSRSKNLEPKQSEDILFEMFIHGWLDKETHHFHPTKYPTAIKGIEDTIRAGEVISIESGKRLAGWAAGGVKNPTPVSSGQPDAKNAATDSDSRGIAYISDEQMEKIKEGLVFIGCTVEKFCQKSEIASLEYLAADRFDGAMSWINKQADKGAA